MPQFRALVFFQNHKGAALSQASEHLGLAMPSASKHVDHLVLRGLLTRSVRAADRRRVAITLTGEGQAVLATARGAACALRIAAGPLGDERILPRLLPVSAPQFGALSPQPRGRSPADRSISPSAS